MRIRTTAAAVAVAALATVGLQVAAGEADAAPSGAASPDQTAAGKCDTSKTYWWTRYGHDADIGTNLHSDWLDGPGAITYQQTATSEANSSWSGSLGVDIDAAIAHMQST